MKFIPYTPYAEYLKCVRFRNIQSDAVVGPWTDMPEVQPPTLTGLIRHMDKYPDQEWDKTALWGDGWMGSGTALKYGPHHQFYLPTELTEEEQERLRTRNFEVPPELEYQYMGPINSVADLFLD